MSEDFLHYIWSFQKFNFRGLKTIKGQPITVLNPGTHNRDAGPDFKNAKLLIGEIEWFGNVEIHINSSSWNRHCHHKDRPGRHSAGIQSARFYV